jgi:hypothetical protein
MITGERWGTEAQWAVLFVKCFSFQARVVKNLIPVAPNMMLKITKKDFFCGSCNQSV